MRYYLINYDAIAKVWEFIIETDTEIEMVEMDEVRFFKEILAKGIQFIDLSGKI